MFKRKEEGKVRVALTVSLLFILLLFVLSSFAVRVLAAVREQQKLPEDMRETVPPEKVKRLEALIGEDVTSMQDYNGKREFIREINDLYPALWKIRKNYYRDISPQEFQEKMLTFVTQLDPHSSYESLNEVLKDEVAHNENGAAVIPPGKEQVQKIQASVLANKYGIIRVVDFNVLDAKGFQLELHNACNYIWANVPSGNVRGIVLDLRGNPGGYQDNAIVLLSAFMQRANVLVLTEKSYNTSGRPKVDLVFSKQDPPGISNARLRGLPLLILVDAGSASCSEIVAGVLQHFKVGVVASSDPHTFGKGVVQTVSMVKLKGTKIGRLTLTTHEYFIGHDYRVQGYGIIPDIRLKGGASGNMTFEEDLDNPIPPSGEAPRFIPMKERNPALDKHAREMLKALKLRDK